MITDLKKFLKTSIIYAAAQIMVQIINFFLLPVYTNKLGTVEYGKLSAITAFTGLFSTLLIMSIQSGVCRFYQEEADKNRLISTSLNFSYLLCIFWVCVLLIFGRPISDIVFDFDSGGQGYSILWLTAVTSMLNQIISIYISRFSMEYKAKNVSMLQLGQVILQFFIIILLVIKMNMGLMGVLYGQFFSAAVFFITLSCLERNNYRFTIEPGGLRNMLIFSVGLLPVNLSGWALTLADRYFIKYYLGLADTGIYNLGYQFGMLINPVFITPFLNSFTAYKFEIYKDQDAREKFKKLFRKYNAVGCFIMLGIAIYSKFGVMVFANREFLEAYKVVPIILYSYFLYGKTGYYALGFQIENKTWKIGQYMAVASIINIALNFITVPKMGIYGAALSTLAAYFILDIMFIISSDKYYKIDIDLLYQFKVQALTLFVYLIYYIISIFCSSIFMEFFINLAILSSYTFLLIKTGLLDYELQTFLCKAAGKVFKKAACELIKFKDLHYDRNGIQDKVIEKSLINIKELDVSEVDNVLLKVYCENYLEHRFNLLGSGWTKVSYDMVCKGLEGHVYDGSMHISCFDRQGIWLESVLNKRQVKISKKIWRLIDEYYKPIDWQMDFKSGFRYSQKKWYLDQPIGHRLGVDIKVPWELCRLQHLNTFAVTALIYPKKRELLIREFKNQVLDFILTNPVRMGVAWTCTMDTAIRAANLLVSYDILSQMDEYNILDHGFRKILYSSIYDHGCFIIKNLEVNERFNGNHYLSDLAGLLFISAYLKGHKQVDTWLEFSIHEIMFQGIKQFYADGSNFEASTSYHRLSGELLAYSTALIIGLGYKLPENYLHRIFRAAQFSMDITKVNGTIPQVGDNDSGRFFKFSAEKDVLNHDSFISAVNGIFESSTLLSRDNYPLERSVVKSLRKNFNTGISNLEPFQGGIKLCTPNMEELSFSLKSEILYILHTEEDIDTANIKKIIYPFFGMYVFKSGNFFLSVMAGGIGQNGVGGHSHNDKLSFDLTLGARDVCRDPGTYLYTPVPEIRNKYRSVNAHNVPVVSGQEQCSFNGLFSMKDEVSCGPVKLDIKNPSFYLTFRDIKMLREFMILEDRLIIVDKCNKPFELNLYADSVSNGYGMLKTNK